ncbi:hypothetical protein Godav_022202 [Gossypium davidsonii]|uniref:Uncharacterized protein n=2 Tax=Gossypium TaxID=3633 RepID=A0A7J8TI54_GOSDV|nr:hypothetical protein [Gossypium davidsonii]MBA0645906.1 hypothetical protein [Gossypium klotzschianum]
MAHNVDVTSVENKKPSIELTGEAGSYTSIEEQMLNQSVKNQLEVLLWDQESKRPEGANWETIPVQGKEVLVTPRAISEFYNTPYYESDFLEENNLEYFRDINMDKVIKYLTEGRGEWKCRPVLLYVVLQKKQVCIETWIHHNMKQYINEEKGKEERKDSKDDEGEEEWDEMDFKEEDD